MSSDTTLVPVVPVFGLMQPELVLSVIVTVVFVWWAIFTIVAGYHLLRFARDSWFTLPALALHLIVSGWLFVFATGGLH